MEGQNLKLRTKNRALRSQVRQLNDVVSLMLKSLPGMDQLAVQLPFIDPDSDSGSDGEGNTRTPKRLGKQPALTLPSPQPKPSSSATGSTSKPAVSFLSGADLTSSFTSALQDQVRSRNSIGQTQIWQTADVPQSDGSRRAGYAIAFGTEPEDRIDAYRLPGGLWGYHEAQRSDHCGRHTLNMLDPNALATEREYDAYVAAEYGLNMPQTEAGSLVQDIQRFQDWRLRQNMPVKPMVSGEANLLGTESMNEFKQAVGQHKAFGVGYTKKGKSAQHNAVIRQVQGAWRVFDSQVPPLRGAEPEALVGTTAVEALNDFLSKKAEPHPQLGYDFEYLVPQPGQTSQP